MVKERPFSRRVGGGGPFLRLRLPFVLLPICQSYCALWASPHLLKFHSFKKRNVTASPLIHAWMLIICVEGRGKKGVRGE